MFSPPGRRRIRPSLLSLAWSLALLAAAIPLAVLFFWDLVYLPLAAMAAIGIPLALYRLRGVRRGLPEPWGGGEKSVIDAKSTVRAGLLLVVGGVLLVVALLGSVFVIPPLYFFVIMFGVTGGFPLSQVSFYVGVHSVERKSGSRIFMVVDETTEDGRDVLVKSLEMLPSRKPTPAAVLEGVSGAKAFS